jgi:hypothetical protein
MLGPSVACGGEAGPHDPQRVGLPGRVEAFKARGVSLFLLDLNGGADDVSGNGIARLFLTIVSAFAEFERDRIGERNPADQAGAEGATPHGCGASLRPTLKTGCGR